MSGEVGVAVGFDGLLWNWVPVNRDIVDEVVSFASKSFLLAIRREVLIGHFQVYFDPKNWQNDSLLKHRYEEHRLEETDSPDERRS